MGISQENRRMDRYERRRLALQQIINDHFDGVDADFARKADIPASYVSCMLYPPGPSSMTA